MLTIVVIGAVTEAVRRVGMIVERARPCLRRTMQSATNRARGADRGQARPMQRHQAQRANGGDGRHRSLGQKGPGQDRRADRAQACFRKGAFERRRQIADAEGALRIVEAAMPGFAEMDRAEIAAMDAVECRSGSDRLDRQSA